MHSIAPRLALVVTLVFLSASVLAAAPKGVKFRTFDKHIGWPGETFNGLECYGKSQGFGPFDYNDPEASRDGGYAQILGGGFAHPLVMVEGAHFTGLVEQLVKGKSGSIGGDIDYTLRAFPNHPRALWAMSRLYLKDLQTMDPGQLKERERFQHGFAPPECYFQRAKVFAPYDGKVSAIFGVYLHRRGLLQQALAEYTIAEKANPDSAEILYNMGLLQIDLGDLAKAREYADRAKQLGYPLSGLQRKVKRLEAEASASTSDLK